MAQAWFDAPRTRPAAPDDANELEKEMRMLGIDEERIASSLSALASRAHRQAEDIALWPAHEAPATTFHAMAASQWRVQAVSGGLAPGRLIFLGLDYAALPVTLAMIGITLTPQQFADFQVIENEAVSLLNEVRH